MSTFRVLNSNIISNNTLLTKVSTYNVDSSERRHTTINITNNYFS